MSIASPPKNPVTYGIHTHELATRTAQGADLGQQHARGQFLRPCRGGVDSHDAFHGLRDGQSTVAPPVATARGPAWAEDSGNRRGNRVHALSGEVPEGRFAPIGSADQHAASGRRVRHG